MKIYFYVVIVVMCHPKQMIICINFTCYSSKMHIKVDDLASNQCSYGDIDTSCTCCCQRQVTKFEILRTLCSFPHLNKKKRRRSKKLSTLEGVDCLSANNWIVRKSVPKEWCYTSDKFHGSTNVVLIPIKTKVTFAATELIILKIYSAIIRNITRMCTKTTNATIRRVASSRSREVSSSLIRQTLTTLLRKMTDTRNRLSTPKHFIRRPNRNKSSCPWVVKILCYCISCNFLTKLRIIHIFFIFLNLHDLAAGLDSIHYLSLTNYPHIRCTSSTIHRKYTMIGTCQDYYECIRWRYGRYIWVKRSCPPHEYFDLRFQLCRMMEIVECRIVADKNNKEKSWHNIITE